MTKIANLRRRRPGAPNSIGVIGREYNSRSSTLEERVEHVGVTVTAAGCHEWNGGKSSTGYGTIKFERKTVTLPRWVLARKLGRQLNRDEVTRHDCDNKACINPDHLRPGTARENSRDAVLRGRHGHGDGNPGVPKPANRKLTDAQVADIRSLRAAGIHVATVADRFGVAVSTVYSLCNGWTRRVGS